jgi:putative FmdB family regulatory protein
MPVYEYRCENGHLFEVLQRMSDGPVTECTVCGAAVKRVFRAPAIHFKGSGFYNTDYGRRGSKPSSESGDGAGGGDKDKGGSKESGKESAGSKESSDGGAPKSGSASEKAA